MTSQLPPWKTMILLGGLCAACGLTGCAVFNKSGGWGDGPPPQSEPDVEDDKWGFVGKQGRGTRPLEDENDPLKPFLMSPQARDIERNLGYK